MSFPEALAPPGAAAVLVLACLPQGPGGESATAVKPDFKATAPGEVQFRNTVPVPVPGGSPPRLLLPGAEPVAQARLGILALAKRPIPSHSPAHTPTCWGP